METKQNNIAGLCILYFLLGICMVGNLLMRAFTTAAHRVHAHS